MSALPSLHGRLLLAAVVALAMASLGCGKSTGGPADASLVATGGADGAATGTGGGGAATGGSTGGSSAGSGGGITDSGGLVPSGTGGAGAGGLSSGSGGSTSGAGGRSSPTGGSTAGTGGTSGASDGAVRDGPGDFVAGKDGVSDAARPPSDAPQDGTAGDSTIPVPSGYRLAWSDEFDVDGKPNPKNWTYEKGFVRNEELQWYQPDNATVKGGLLVIEGRKERVSNPSYQAGSSDWKTSRQYAEYTATSMTTSGLQSWQYGRFEMRARIPTSAGMWPAWWTLGTSGEWPSGGEIDIMEYYRGNVLANVACGTATRWQAKWDSSTKAISSLGANWSSSFHVWRMDWDDQKIDLFLDDALMNSVPLSSMLNPDGESPFRQKHYMLVNLAIGGTNGGDPAGTTFPARYEVDYLRVFQKL